MARPVKKRNICALPTTREFCPKGGGDGEDAQGKHLLILKQSELLGTNSLSQLH